MKSLVEQERGVGSYPEQGRDLVTRTLRHHALWLVLTYVGLIALMARAYA